MSSTSDFEISGIRSELIMTGDGQEQVRGSGIRPEVEASESLLNDKDKTATIVANQPKDTSSFRKTNDGSE